MEMSKLIFQMKKILFNENTVEPLKRGFSMIELAVFITVISFILVSVALSISGDVENNKAAITKKRIDRIYNSLGLYVAQNDRLPCPAAINKVLSDSDYGDEGISGGNCLTTAGSYFEDVGETLVYGMVPIKKLGLSLDDSVDGYGSKIVYVVDKSFAENTNNFSSDTGTITVKNYINSVSSNATTQALFVLISYGKNKSGAFNMNSENDIAASLDIDEIDNGSASLNTDFTAFTDRTAGTFDDIVFYKNSKADFLLDFDIYNLISSNRTESND